MHVFEKRDEVGGQLLPGSVPGHKKELRSLIRFQAKQAEIFGVHFHSKQEITPDDIKKADPDVIVLATGSLPALSPIDGIEKEIVLTFQNVLNGTLL